MPARKSNASTAAASGAANDSGLSIDDLTLPRSMVQRLAKGVLPANTQIHRDALLAMHRSATVFVNYLASHANENTLRTGKKTIQPHDVFEALKEIEFQHFLPRLENEYQKFVTTQTDKRNTYRRKVKEEKLAAAAKPNSEGEASQLVDGEQPADAAAAANGDGGSPGAVARAAHGDAEPATKKARRDKDAAEEGSDGEDFADPTEELGSEEDDDEVVDDDVPDEDEEEEEEQEDLVEDTLETAEKKDGDNSDDDMSD